MTRALRFFSLPILFTVAACAGASPRANTADAQHEVEATERAFAQTMASRDFAAFQTFIADEAVFFNGDTPLRGKAEVAAQWRSFFDGAAPFSWEPSHVEVLATGDLALSTGPVRDASGKTVATFNSIWRRDRSGKWRVVFDRGSDVCAHG
jgi:ketosteroid isomerase-like protein